MLEVTIKAKELLFDPPYKNFKDILCNVLSTICEAVARFERLETQLYIDWTGPTEYLKVLAPLKLDFFFIKKIVLTTTTKKQHYFFSHTYR